MRYHINTAGTGSVAEWGARLPNALLEVRQAIVAAAPSVSGPTVYTGAAGVAYALACADSSLLPLAAQLAAASGRADLRRCVPESVLDGEAGVAMVQAIVGSAADPSVPVTGPISRFLACCKRSASPSPYTSDEVLYGRAGTLLGALILNRDLGRQVVDNGMLADICRAVLQSGRSLSSRLGLGTRGGPPLFYTWPEGGGRGNPYLGAAHGLVGIVHALLHCWDLLPSVDERAQSDVLSTLDYIMAQQASLPGRVAPGGHWPVMCGEQVVGEARDPALVHWCHGSPGVAMMLCKAFEVTKSQPYLAAATAAGELVWERGLLGKGPGLCHGVSGNAYALLSVWRATRDPIWHQRAQRFAAFMVEDGGGRADWQRPDHPASLFEGLAGGLCLLSDLVKNPEGARFPFFEV